MNTSLFFQGITIGLAVAIPIGPIALICIKEGLRGSFASTCALALGVSTADAIYSVIGALGLSTINLFLNRFQTAIEFVGISFILYLGISALVHGIPQQSQQECSTGTLIQTYLSTLILTLTSPMTIILFAGIFAGMGTNEITLHTAAIGSLTLGVFVGTCGWFILLGSVVLSFRRWFTPRHLAWINSAAGIFIILFALQRFYSIVL